MSRSRGSRASRRAMCGRSLGRAAPVGVRRLTPARPSSSAPSPPGPPRGDAGEVVASSAPPRAPAARRGGAVPRPNGLAGTHKLSSRARVKMYRSLAPAPSRAVFAPGRWLLQRHVKLASAAAGCDLGPRPRAPAAAPSRVRPPITVTRAAAETRKSSIAVLGLAGARMNRCAPAVGKPAEHRAPSIAGFISANTRKSAYRPPAPRTPSGVLVSTSMDPVQHRVSPRGSRLPRFTRPAAPTARFSAITTGVLPAPLRWTESRSNPSPTLRNGRASFSLRCGGGGVGFGTVSWARDVAGHQLARVRLPVQVDADDRWRNRAAE